VRNIEVNSSAQDTDKERMRRLEIFRKVRRRLVSNAVTSRLRVLVMMFVRDESVFVTVADDYVTGGWMFRGGGEGVNNRIRRW
jgi:hypothetical protein